MTARKSAPASTSGPQFCCVMPPIAQHGTTVVSLQSRSSSGSLGTGGGLGRAREEGAERDVVGAGVGGDDGAVAARTAGHPDDMVRAEEAPGLGVRRVFFTDMHPVAIQLGGEIGPVVHDERDAPVLGDRFQDPRRAPDRVVVDLFEA